MSYAFDIPEPNAAEDERVVDEGEDLVSDDEEDQRTILSMIRRCWGEILFVIFVHLVASPRDHCFGSPGVMCL